MKILIVIPEFPVNIEDIKGGVISALSNLLHGFSQMDNVKVKVLSFNRYITGPIIKEYSPDIEINYLPEGKFPHAFNFMFKGSFIVKRYIREFNPDIVHYAMSGYILLTKAMGLYNKIHVVTIHGISFREARHKKEVKQKLVLYTNGLAEMLLCPKNIIHISNYSRLLFMDRKNRSVIIPNAINPSYFKLPLKHTTDNRLLYIGGIETNKNILFLLNALKSLVHLNVFFSLDVVGDYVDDFYKTEVVSFIQKNKLGEYITFHGWVNQQRVQQVLIQADILVVSSKQETLPMVIAEAMSAGKVVVSTTAGGIPEMVEDGVDGFLYALPDVEGLVSMLQKLYNNTSLVLQIQARARKKAMQTYGSKEVAERTISFYQALLKNINGHQTI